MSFISDVPFGHKAKGLEVSKPSKDVGYYEKVSNGKISIVPTTTYCPSCSATHEFKYGKVVRKWALKHGDLQFNISYRENENEELYAVCDNCGFDLRKDMLNHEIKDKQISDLKRDLFIEGAHYTNGCYFIDYQDFKDTLKTVTNGENVRICIKQRIGPSLNILELDESIFNNLSDLVIEGSNIGIPRSYWRNN